MCQIKVEIVQVNIKSAQKMSDVLLLFHAYAYNYDSTFSYMYICIYTVGRLSCIVCILYQIFFSIGASVVVETQAVPQLFSRTVYNQFCFLQFEQGTEQSIKPPKDWRGVCNV